MQGVGVHMNMLLSPYHSEYEGFCKAAECGIKGAKSKIMNPTNIMYVKPACLQTHLLEHEGPDI